MRRYLLGCIYLVKQVDNVQYGMRIGAAEDTTTSHQNLFVVSFSERKYGAE